MTCQSEISIKFRDSKASQMCSAAHTTVNASCRKDKEPSAVLWIQEIVLNASIASFSAVVFFLSMAACISVSSCSDGRADKPLQIILNATLLKILRNILKSLIMLPCLCLFFCSLSKSSCTRQLRRIGFFFLIGKLSIIAVPSSSTIFAINEMIKGSERKDSKPILRRLTR